MPNNSAPFLLNPCDIETTMSGAKVVKLSFFFKVKVNYFSLFSSVCCRGCHSLIMLHDCEQVLKCLGFLCVHIRCVFSIERITHVFGYPTEAAFLLSLCFGNPSPTIALFKVSLITSMTFAFILRDCFKVEMCCACSLIILSFSRINAS